IWMELAGEGGVGWAGSKFGGMFTRLVGRLSTPLGSTSVGALVVADVPPPPAAEGLVPPPPAGAAGVAPAAVVGAAPPPESSSPQAAATRPMPANRATATVNRDRLIHLPLVRFDDWRNLASGPARTPSRRGSSRGRAPAGHPQPADCSSPLGE